MTKEKKITEGSASELFDPAQTIVELGTNNNEQALLALQQSQWQQYLQPRRNESLLLKMHRNEIPDFNKWLVNENINVHLLQPRNSLEDFFLQVTSAKQHVETFSN